jgi:hypothetical protein
MQKKDIVAAIKNKKMPVIIYGAGIVGKALLDICKKEGIKVDCFCDYSKKVCRLKFCGLKVFYTPHLKEKYKEAIFIISVASIKDVVERLRELGYLRWYAGSLLLKGLSASQDHSTAAIDYTKYAMETCIFCHKAYLNPDKLFLRSIDFIITERCSLKCRDCSNLMQYYEKPKDCNTKMLLKSIDVFFTVIDEVLEFRIIGGEAFMNKDWPIITERVIAEPKAKRVVLYTNGTIIPQEKNIALLKNGKIFLVVTDYGALSKKIIRLRQILEQENIAYHILKMPEWLNCAKIIPHHRATGEKIEIFKDCCAKNMATLSDGKLFRCPYAANAFRLQAAPESKKDYIDFFKEPFDATNLDKTRKKLNSYLGNLDYLETCDYCRGRPLSGDEVPPAEQVGKPLGYHKYKYPS